MKIKINIDKSKSIFIRNLIKTTPDEKQNHLLSMYVYKMPV